MRDGLGDSVLRLTDGRDLGMRHYGDPQGFPIVYFHGHPGSRMDLDFIDPDQLGRALGARIIALDRPGYGLSSGLPGRALNDWPDDVIAAVDHLGIQQFAVLGYSGGGPYAVACAAHIPASRLVRTAVVAGIGPVGSPGQHRSLGWTMYSGAPGLIRRPVTKLSATLAGRIPDRIAVRGARAALPRPDREALADARIAAGLMATWREAFRTGHAGASSDIEVYTRPWGIDIGALSTPIRWWHGTADRNVPVGVGRFVAEQIPNCHATIETGAGHLSIWSQLAQILGWLQGGANQQ